MDKIMIVDDEKDIIYMIRDFMEIYDIEVIEASSGEEALKKLDNTVQLVILDINMEGMTGIETCKKIREKSNVPILFLTARASQADKILGLGIGGDDYITKPFDPLELVARVQAHMRRHHIYSKQKESEDSDVMVFGEITVYVKQRRVVKKGKDVPLTGKEFDLLLYMAQNPFIVLSREQILNHVWNNSMYDDNVVTTNIKRLRKKLGDDPENPQYIKTVWGIGYVFEGRQRNSVHQQG